MKYTIAILVLVLALSACGAKKKVTNRERLHQLELKQNDIKELLTTLTIKTSEIRTFNKVLMYEPIDSTKPYVIASQTFDNVKITASETDTKENSTTTTETNANKTDKTKTTTETETNKRSSDSVSIRQSPWVWFAVIVIGCFIVYRWVKN